MNNIFILIGPTASGKSNLAMLLMSKFPFEIINADLYSTYKGLNIGTAKPTKEELNKYKHHLINILEPTMDYNVSQYCKDANKCINEILSSNKIPLITGGSMMYVYQLLNGLSHEYNVSDTDLKLIKFIQNQYTNEQIVKAISSLNPALIDKINIGEQIKVYLNIKGRKWTNKEGKINYFNSLQAWKIEFENETLEVKFKDYYFSNVIARSSKTMLDCNNSKIDIKLTGTEG